MTLKLRHEFLTPEGSHFLLVKLKYPSQKPQHLSDFEVLDATVEIKQIKKLI